MNQLANSVVFGAPGIELRWASSAKEAVGTAYHNSCRLWFTLSHGIINEIYHPHVDQPNTRNCQFLITDGETFCHEEKRDLDHQIEYPERDCVFYRLTDSEHPDRYRLIKYLLTDPHRLVLLVHTALLGRKVPSPKVVERFSSFAGQRTAHMANSVGHSARQGCPVVQD